MGTRSTIAVARPSDGKIISVYCHWDGYIDIDYNGRLLVENYNTQELAERLVSQGNISSLGEKADPSPGLHSYNSPQDGVTVYYGRDRDEDNVDAKSYTSIVEWAHQNKEEYNYIFIDGEWLCWQGWRSYKTMIDVAKELKRKSKEGES